MIETKHGIIGLAIGDAMGVPLEFRVREKLMQSPTTTMIGYGSHNVPKGSFSDDTSMTLATIDSIINTGGIDVIDIAKNFIEWFRNAKYTPSNLTFDIGRTTLNAISKCERNIEEAQNAGGDNEMDNGNGSLMRILPIAYYCYAKNCNKIRILDIVRRVSGITHRHEISIMGCYMYVLYTIELLKGATLDKAYKKIKEADYSMFSNDTINRYSRIIEKDISKFDLDDISSDGYVVSTLEATLWVLLNTTSYNQAIIGAINLGSDTDTIGACVGGIAGIFYGIESINPDWKIDLIKYDYIKELCEKLDIVLLGNMPVSKSINKSRAKLKVEIVNADITTLNVDAIVNSANTSLLGGDGVDGAIHKKAGSKLLEKCRELNGCENGKAKITRGYNLNAKYIIHAVAPRWNDYRIENKEELLESCYNNSFKIARDFGIRTIAFPCIGMGIYGCPIDKGTKIAIDTAIKNAQTNYIDRIILVCYTEQEYNRYIDYYNKI